LENVVDVDAGSWQREVSESSVLTAVYFWHEQCPWCFRFGPILDEVAGGFRGRIRFLRLNVLASPLNQEVASGYGVMSTPTLLFLCRGRPVGQIVGLVSGEDLERGLRDILGRYQECLSRSSELRPSYVV
jgi:thioredoxin 1